MHYAQMSSPLIGQCMAHSRVSVSRLVSPVCGPLSLFVSGFTSSTSILSLSLSISLPSISISHPPSPLHLTSSLPPFLFSSSNPFYSHLSTNFVSTGPNRNLTSFVNFSAAGPDSRRRINAGFIRFSLLHLLKKIKASRSI